MQKFHTFLDKKYRKQLEELSIINDVLKIGGLKSKKMFEDKFDPYLFVNTNEQTPFGGIRVYKIDHTIAYRSQNEPETQPFGTAYAIPVEKMFEDYLDDDDNGDKIGGIIAKAIVDEVKYFFKKNAEAYQTGQMIKMPYQIMIPPIGAADNYRDGIR